ncbi:MAG: DUF11 domain-containing protein [Flavobacteriales bacterium]|nr:DUF11 domain-containing protein [Flavobacteriales bacterium]
MRRYLILALLLAANSLRAQLPIVDIGLFTDTPDTLTVRILPHGPFGGLVSLQFTLRWPAGSAATLGQEEATCPLGLPIGQVQTVVSGNHRYASYFGDYLQNLVNAGCPWSGSEEVVVVRIPVANSTDLSEFQLVNDGWTYANNSSFFVSLNGFDRTGSFYGSSAIGTQGNGLVIGDRFFENTGDCSHGADPGMAFRTMTIEPGGIDVITGATGAFTRELAPGAYTLEVPTEPYAAPACGQTLSVPFTVPADSVVLLPIIDTLPPLIDLQLLGMTGTPRPGMDHGVYLNVRNLGGAVCQNAQVTLTFAPLLGFVDALPYPSTSASGSLTWVLPPIAPQGSRNIMLWLSVPPDPGLTGTVLPYAATVTHPSDVDLANNSAGMSAEVVNSLDPNDILVTTDGGSGSTDFVIGQDTMLTYTIRFQNTGTAPAYQVTVTDTLSPDVDMSTFVQGVGSHPFTVRFKPGRVVEWQFNSINLPDSSTNERKSHGAVRFHIRPQAPLMPGTAITNSAGIVFDLNPPVITNEATVVLTTSTGLAQHTATTLALHPVPTSDLLHIRASDPDLDMLVIRGADGRMVRTVRIAEGSATTNVSDLPCGAYMVEGRSAGGMLRARFIKQ